MARYCLDASFILGWLFPEQQTSAIRDRWLTFASDDELVAPSLLLAECTSVLHEHTQRWQRDRALARELLSMLFQFPIRIVNRPEIYQRAFEIAGQLNHDKAYDSLYIAVAELEGGELLTLDSNMHRGALRLSVSSTLVRL